MVLNLSKPEKVVEADQIRTQTQSYSAQCTVAFCKLQVPSHPTSMLADTDTTQLKIYARI